MSLNKVNTWMEDAAGKLYTSREIVEPIFHEIKLRALSMGLANRLLPVPLTNDPELYLYTEWKETIHSLRKTNQYVVFKIPFYVTEVHLVSRSSRPSNVIGPFLDDRRVLGVLVGNIVLYTPWEEVFINIHLKNSALQGWDILENSFCRWTKGNAVLPIRQRSSCYDPVILAIQILAGGPYPV